MAKINIQNPDEFSKYNFSINYEPWSVRYLGNNSDLIGKNIYWAIHNKVNLNKDYRISLILNSEVEPGDFVGKFRVIIRSLETDISRAIFLNKEQIDDLEDFGRIIAREISNMEYRTAQQLPF